MAASRQPNFQQFLERLTSRSVLDEDEQHAILDLPGHFEKIGANRDFVRLGDCVDHACLVANGYVGRFDQNGDGGRQITAIHLPGDFPDLHSVVQPTATSALQTLSVTTIFRVPHISLRRIASRFPAIAEAFWRDCMVDASILAQWVVNVGRRDAKSRIAHLLCEVAVRMKVDRRSAPFLFPLEITQTHLADATGLTVVHVNRMLRQLREQGIADVRRTEVEVQDWCALVAAGDFDPNYLHTNARPAERIRIAGVI